MSVERIRDLESRTQRLEDNQNTLIAELQNSTKETRSLTESNIHLTSEIKHLVKIVEKSSEDQGKLERRVTDNEKDIAIIKSKNQWQDWVGKAVVTTIVAGILSAAFYIKG